MNDEADFQKQLELEALEKQKEENPTGQSDPYTYTDPNDGTTYEWNCQKQAWFPKVTDDFIASYQANYNYQEDTKTEEKASSSNAEALQQQQQIKKGEKRKANDPSWFQVDDAHNTNVYVSGLPSETTEEEFVELMSKCGLIMKDPDTMKYKIKLYRDTDGTLKGDGRCCYIKIESVGLALNILDGSQFKGKEIRVERANFQLKGAYDPSKKPKRKKKDKEKLKRKLEKLFDWRPDKLRGMRSRHENTVIIKNMFDPKEFEADASLLLDYQKDIREECSKCGQVKKVVIYDRNPEGVVAVTFTEPEMADECINLMNGRWFAARQLTAQTWDGKTKYKIIETEEEREKRLKDWEKFLQTGKKNEETSVVIDSSQNSSANHVSSVDQKDNQVVPQDAYILAGETDSSGVSGDENDQEVSSSSSALPPTSSEKNQEFFSASNSTGNTSETSDR